MNTCRLLILAAICVIFLVLFVQGKNENEVSESDVELQGHNLREKRSYRFYSRRCLLTYLKKKKWLLKRVLKEVDCLDNKKCRFYQKKLFGEIFKPPTPAPPMSPIPSPSSSPVMTVSPSSSQVVSSMPAVSPSSSQVVSSMPAVSPTPSSSSVMVSQTV
nr:glycoprotein gp100-like isoform X2 [Pocillopora verrucosa]